MTYPYPPPPRRRGVHPLVWVALGVVLLPFVVALAIPLVVAIGGRGDAEADAPKVNEPAPAQHLKLGETHRGAGLDTTVLQVRPIRGPAAHARVDEEWIGVRVKECAHPDDPSSGRAQTTWSAVDMLGYTVYGGAGAWPGFPGQLLPDNAPRPGACNEGWLLFSVGEDRGLQSVAMGSVAVWTVAKT